MEALTTDDPWDPNERETPPNIGSPIDRLWDRMGIPGFWQYTRFFEAAPPVLVSYSGVLKEYHGFVLARLTVPHDGGRGECGGPRWTLLLWRGRTQSDGILFVGGRFDTPAGPIQVCEDVGGVRPEPGATAYPPPDDPDQHAWMSRSGSGYIEPGRDVGHCWFLAAGAVSFLADNGVTCGLNPRALANSSGVVPVLEDVEPTRFTLSPSGAVLYSTQSSRAPSELVWVSKSGAVQQVDSTWRGFFEYPAISPDGSALAVSLRGKTTDLWVRRTEGTRQKIIAGGVANWRPSWTADGKSLAFTSIRNPDDPHDVAAYIARADGSARAELLFAHEFGVWEAELSRDGEWLVVRMDEMNFNSNVRARRLRGDTALLPLLVDSAAESSVALSPDTRWLAYASDEAGKRYEVYVASFPDMGSKVMVSSDGGTAPRWSRDGRELFFESAGRLMAVQVPAGPSFNPGNPTALFSLAGYRRARNRPQYDVGRDGRFVFIREGSTETGARAVYVENWFTELLAKVKR